LEKSLGPSERVINITGGGGDIQSFHSKRGKVPKGGGHPCAKEIQSTFSQKEATVALKEDTGKERGLRAPSAPRSILSPL